MSTFIVRFVGDTADAFRGKVSHVATGEEAVFASPRELLAFLEGMNAVAAVAGSADSAATGARAPAASSRTGPQDTQAREPRGRSPESAATRRRSRQTSALRGGAERCSDGTPDHTA